MEKIIVVDAETTGINVLKDDPIQIGYLIYEGRQKVRDGEIFIRTENLPAEITQITGITQELLDKKGIDPVAAAKTWYSIVEEENPDVVVGHNVIAFDLVLLSNWLNRTLLTERFRLPPINSVYDTMTSARKILGVNKYLKLETLARELGVEVDSSRLHNALYDIDITAQCYFALKEKVAPSASTSTQGPQQLLF